MEKQKINISFWRTVAMAAIVATTASAQLRQQPDPKLVARRNEIEEELRSLAIVERKLMVPMRDGKRMATDVYRPKDTSKKYPTIFFRTPYNFDFWDLQNGAPRDLNKELEAIKRGYAFVEMNERGHFFSEVRPSPMVGTPYLGWLPSRGRTAKSAPLDALLLPSGKWASPHSGIRPSPR
jgi:predicted acyl esterase